MKYPVIDETFCEPPKELVERCKEEHLTITHCMEVTTGFLYHVLDGNVCKCGLCRVIDGELRFANLTPELYYGLGMFSGFVHGILPDVVEVHVFLECEGT